MKYLKNLFLLVITILVTYFFCTPVGNYYAKLINEPGTFVDLRFLIGIPLVYIFFLILLFTGFGDSKKYWWFGILLIPAAVFEIYFDWQHIYIPIILGLVGWGVGYGISKLMPKPKM